MDSQSALYQTEECPAGKIRTSIPKKGLECSNKTPRDHLYRDPAVRANPFGYKLRWHLREEEAHQEDCLACVVIVCVHAQVA